MASNSIPYFKSWLIHTILSALLAMGVGMVVGFVLGFAMAVVGASPERIQIVCSIAGLIMGFVVSFFVFRWVVDTFIVPSVQTSTTKSVTGGFDSPSA